MAVKTLGPFTGRQLTTIICVTIVTVLLPVGAWAVTGTTSFITDHTTGKTATVNASGQLVTSALIAGGAVTATESSPKNFYNSTGAGLGVGYFPIATPAAGQALVITSITDSLYLVGRTGGNDYIEWAVSGTNTSCTSIANRVFTDIAQGVGTKSFSFQPGIVVPGGRSLCAHLSDDVNLGGLAYAHGYRIFAASAPAGS